MLKGKKLSEINMGNDFYDNTNGVHQEILDEIATREFDNPDYNNLRDDEKFLMLASLISDDPADDLNPIFQDLLKSYVKFKTFTNAEEAKIAGENTEPGIKKRKIQAKSES